ncbi:MAG: phosphate ABC transporter substrate-binding protein [Verrucomicrobiota bacterium]|jgi:phosphate transport system substrate-binding protein
MKIINDCFDLRRITLAGSLGLMVLGVVVAGCGNPGKIIIRGSNTFGEELAPRLIAEYRKEHPTVVFDTEYKGTTYGMGALMVERCDIAAASRPVSTNEVQLAKDRDVEFNDHVIGAYSVAVIVNAGSPIGNLTRDQVRDIFTGAVTNWKEVGGPDAPIHLCSRDEISGTYLGFRELAMENKPYALGLKAFTNYLGIIQKVAQDANGIGYASIDLGSKDGVRAVSIGGVAPTIASVNGGQYPYARVLHLYTDTTKESSPTREFVQFVQSKRGQEILTRMGFVPRP